MLMWNKSVPFLSILYDNSVAINVYMCLLDLHEVVHNVFIVIVSFI